MNSTSWQVYAQFTMSSFTLDKLMSEINLQHTPNDCYNNSTQATEIVANDEHQPKPLVNTQETSTTFSSSTMSGFHHKPQSPTGYCLAQKSMTTSRLATSSTDNTKRNSKTTISEVSKMIYEQEEQAREAQQHQQQQHQLDHQDTELKYRVGYWWSEKKSQKLNADKLSALFAERQCDLVKLDFDRHLDQQGPFNLIVHKISDILVKADQGDTVAKKTISAFESYVRKHPQTIILDPLDNNRALLDRYKQYRLIEQSDLAKENVVFTPPFVHLTSTNIDVNRGRIRRSKITFPIVCKPILAQGTQGAHQMSIIFSEAGLKDIKPPCVAQSFVNHNAKLFKLFVIKDKYHIMERPSLKNFQAGDRDSVFFFSHDISKPNSSSSLTELDEVDKQNLKGLIDKWAKNDSRTNSLSNIEVEVDGHFGLEGDTRRVLTTPKYSPLKPSNEILSKIVKIFSEKLGLTFYGIDIIIENGTNRYAIIDMNTFPGYDGVENFLSIFCDVVCDAIPKMSAEQLSLQQQQTILLNKRKPTEHDSGIEST